MALTQDGGGNTSGYGRALAKAVEDIQKNYIIEEIIPINYHVGMGSATKELIVRVKPRPKELIIEFKRK